MKAEILPPLSSPSFKVNGTDLNLRLSLQDVKESSDEEEAVNNSQDKAVNGLTQAWAQSRQALSFDDVADGSQRPTATTKAKRRSQSAKRPLQNGQVPRSESPVRSKSNSSSHKPVPPKSAPSLRQRGPNKGRPPKSREQGSAEESPERRENSLSPHRNQMNRARSLQGSNRQPRKRLLSSRSEDFSSSSGDLQSPRSVSDRPQPRLNDTTSSESSDDPRQFALLSSSPTLGGHASNSLWDFFEEHVRTIHDSSDMFSRHQGPSFHASSTFQETMTEIYGYPDYSNPPPCPNQVSPNAAARGMFIAGAANRFLRLRKRSTMVGGMTVEQVDQQTVENAKRGWRVLKQYVQENFSSKRTSQAALSWSMLRHTLKGLSDREKTRMDLYRRYGIIPTVDDSGKLVMVNTMLSERARKAIANGSRHPLLAHGAKFPPHDKTLSSPSLPAAFSSPFSSPRSSAESGQRRVQSSVARGSRADFRSQTSMSGSRLGGGGGVPLKNGMLRKSTDLLMSRS